LCGLKENERERHWGGQAIDREMYIPRNKRERDLLIFRYKKGELMKERERGERTRDEENALWTVNVFAGSQ
jgi:hypothetical protein